MKISYSWLQKYFDDKLPAPEKVAEMLTLRAYEVEKIEKVGDDFVFEIDVLPNRAHDSLCHRGVAREVGAIFDMQVKVPERQSVKISKTAGLNVKIENAELCRRYIGRVVENVKVAPSPEWLVKRLEAIGQRSINNIVDATNFVMFDMGQPLHAFDAGKLAKGKGESYEVIVCSAKAGEKISTLDGKDIALDESMFVIADPENALAIAGVKGGVKAQVDEGTTTLVLEAANFHPTAVRKTSQKIAVRTDSSKRFENEIHPELAAIAIKELTRLIWELSSEARAGEVVDEYPAKNNFAPHEMAATISEINELLGTSLSREEIEGTLKKFGWKYKTEGNSGDLKFFVIPPVERLDITIKQDVIEEIGRMYSYENISPTLPKIEGFTAEVNKEFYYANKARDILVELGFSEVETSSFSPQGKVALENPIADGKEFLRESLLDGIAKALDLNYKNAALLGLDAVKIFEIGTVFDKGLTSSWEHTELALACKKGDVKKEAEKFFEKLGARAEVKIMGATAIINFSKLTDGMPPPLPRGGARSAEGSVHNKYKKISPYPFIVRDIALFVPENVKTEEIAEILTKNSGELLVRPPKLFDKFQKEGSDKISYAFRLVFQSQEKTLQDVEVNAIMQKVTAALGKQDGWEVR